MKRVHRTTNPWHSPSGAVVEYWFTIAFAVLQVFLANGDVENTDRIYRLFGAGYLILHAHGRRILAAVRDLDTGQSNAGGA